MLASRDGSADLVAAAIITWDRRPAIDPLEGPSSERLQAAFDNLPEPPVGDIAPHPDVLAALRGLDLAEEAVRVIGEPPTPSTAGARRHVSGRVLAAPVAVIAVASLLVWLGQPLAALAVGGVALVITTWGIARTLGATTDRALLEARDRDQAAAWEARRRALDDRVQAARNVLLAAVAARGPVAGVDARAAWLAYRSACEERAGLAVSSARREAIEAQLAARQLAEESTAARQTAVDDAKRALREAADAVGVPHDGRGPEQIRAALQDWQRRQAAEIEGSRVAIEEWQELVTLLGGGALSDLAREATRRAQIASQLEAALPELTTSAPTGSDVESRIEQGRQMLAQAEAQAAEHRGALESSARALPDVAEAEEAVVKAGEELARVEATAQTIDETLRLLRLAQERVHRDLAPILADAVQRWLPTVSGGAYAEVTVDPADLSIQVKETRTGIWRVARLLSEGTREQIYLLLRVAMAQHLVTTDETAPLLLDEVTAQADGERRAALLSVLHALSADRQIILFTHDAEVAAWAERTLAGPQDRLIRLPSITRPQGPPVERRVSAIGIEGELAAQPAPVAG